jgi:hypothetical protein
VDDECAHVWVETMLACDVCGEHEGLMCIECYAYVDLVYDDDPREERRGLA